MKQLLQYVNVKNGLFANFGLFILLFIMGSIPGITPMIAILGILLNVYLFAKESMK